MLLFYHIISFLTSNSTKTLTFQHFHGIILLHSKKGGIYMYICTLQQLLPKIEPFLENDSYSRFVFELGKVPDVEVTFRKLLMQNPAWSKAVENAMTKDEGEVYFNYEAHFITKKSENDKPQPNSLDLGMWDFGTKPVIAVYSYHYSVDR